MTRHAALLHDGPDRHEARLRRCRIGARSRRRRSRHAWRQRDDDAGERDETEHKHRW